LNNVSYWDGCDMLLDNLLGDTVYLCAQPHVHGLSMTFRY